MVGVGEEAFWCFSRICVGFGSGIGEGGDFRFIPLSLRKLFLLSHQLVIAKWDRDSEIKCLKKVAMLKIPNTSSWGCKRLPIIAYTAIWSLILACYSRVIGQFFK